MSQMSHVIDVVSTCSILQNSANIVYNKIILYIYYIELNTHIVSTLMTSMTSDIYDIFFLLRMKTFYLLQERNHDAIIIQSA